MILGMVYRYLPKLPNYQKGKEPDLTTIFKGINQLKIFNDIYKVLHT